MFDADPDYQLLAIGADAPLTYFRWLFARKIEAEKGTHAPHKIRMARLPSAAAPFARRNVDRVYLAATTMISTLYCGAASLASTVARAGVLPGETQASHAAFISGNVFMSVM